MKTVLICPADRPGVTLLAETAPLAIIPLLGKSLLEYWIEALVARGVKHVIVLASDRPHQVREIVGDGRRWGVTLELIPEARELTVEEARTRHPGDEIILLDRLPDEPEQALFESYAGWFAAVWNFLPRAVAAPARIGAREIQPGIWAGLHAHISPRATLHAPCWIGENVIVGDHAVIGPDAILEDRSVVETGARVAHSIVGPETFVGRWISVQHSLASGGTIVNWQSGSCLRVPDAFFLCSLDQRRFATPASGLIARSLAVGAMLVTAPFAVAMALVSLVRGESPLVLKLGVRPQRNARSAALQTFAYYELAGGRNWLRRWPQFWNVVRGDLTWVGNRPLRPTQALALVNDFERLWLTAPVGLVSLADAFGCIDEPSDEVCAHSSYYAVNASRRLNWFVLTRTFYRALAAWPIRWTRRKHSSIAVPQLVPKQEI
jgi:hypothetical protein